MADDSMVDELVRVLKDFESWSPWSDLKFAVSAGIELSFFLPTIRIALRELRIAGSSAGTLSDRQALDLLVKRARVEAGLEPESPRQPVAKAAYPNPHINSITAVSKRAGDIRVFSKEEIAAASERLKRDFPEIFFALKEATIENRRECKEPFEGQIYTSDGYSSLIDPISHAIFGFMPTLDSLDNSALSRAVFRHLQCQVLAAR